MKRDKLFAKKKNGQISFSFNKKTAEIFDDMIERSVPLYHELQRMIGEIANEFAQKGTNVYDLGCSTGTTLCSLYNNINENVKFIGIDFSKPMLDKCRKKLVANNIMNNFKLVCADLNKSICISKASVVILNLTLQFIRPANRGRLIKAIYEGLIDKGCLIIVEKVLENDSAFDDMFIKFYYALKARRGYSKLEIANKRKALDNMLIPYRINKNRQLLLKNGFSRLETFYKWYNFCGFLAIK